MDAKLSDQWEIIPFTALNNFDKQSDALHEIRAISFSCMQNESCWLWLIDEQLPVWKLVR